MLINILQKEQSFDNFVYIKIILCNLETINDICQKLKFDYQKLKFD